MTKFRLDHVWCNGPVEGGTLGLRVVDGTLDRNVDDDELLSEWPVDAALLAGWYSSRSVVTRGWSSYKWQLDWLIEMHELYGYFCTYPKKFLLVFVSFFSFRSYSHVKVNGVKKFRSCFNVNVCYRQFFSHVHKIRSNWFGHLDSVKWVFLI